MTSSNAWYARRALAMPALPRSSLASSLPIASRRLSTSVSTRETKKDATEAIVAMSTPLSRACSSPVTKAFMTAR
jgi:hypothetical protein